jgi:signal transduction histidine kinase
MGSGLGALVTTTRDRSMWPWLIGTLSTAMALASVPLLAIDWPTFKPGRIEPTWVTAFVSVMGPIWVVVVFSALTGFILSRRPRSPLGWAFAATALLLATTLFMQEYAVRALLAAPGSMPAGEFAAWIGTWTSPGSGILLFPYALAILMFPDGRLPGRAWWVAAVVVGVVITSNLLGSLGQVWPLGLPLRDGSVPVTMPPALWNVGFALAGWPSQALGWANLAMAPAVAALVLVRTRRAIGDERLQLRWLAYAIAIVAVSYMVGFVSDERISPWAFDTNAQVIARWGQLLSRFLGAWFVLPVALAVAIFKYRLYEIDVVISRTLLFGGLAAFITLTYVAVVFGLGSLVRAGAGLDQLLALVATAIVAVAFQPLRERLSRLANRLVYGERRTPYEVLSRFGSRAAVSYSADEVLPQLAGLLREATGAERTEAWLRVGSEIRRAAVNPASAYVPPIPVEDDRLPTLPDTDCSVPVRDQGALLGALAITKRRGERVAPADAKLLADLASHTSLVLRNLRLVEELRASRQRIVRAQDEARRRVERNLHDGAQQRLVALSLLLGRARVAADRSHAMSSEFLATAEGELRAALGELRELAHGIHPTVLVTGGLEPALQSLAARSPIPVDVSVATERRLPEPAEVAAYYVVSEALANVTKHSRATAARVSVSRAETCVVIEVSDDGVGGADAAAGGGLEGLADRTAAIGGRLSIVSPTGGGTLLRAEIPCA